MKNGREKRNGTQLLPCRCVHRKSYEMRIGASTSQRHVQWTLSNKVNKRVNRNPPAAGLT